MAESDLHNQELPIEGVGAQLRRSRERADLTLGDIASRTKIAERHLASIEESRFGDLASRTYAVGFARAYARTVGLDEGEIAQAVRDELAETDRAREAEQVEAFEPGDPARVPGSGIAIFAGLCAVVAIAVVAIFWRSFFSPAASLPELTAQDAAAPASASAAPTRPATVAAPSGPVVFTATAENVWVKFYDAAGRQLMQKQMAQGESYTVPGNADGPMIRTARPDALRIAIGGKDVPRLGDKAVTISDVPVSAAALLARAKPAQTSDSAESAPARQAAAEPTAIAAPAAAAPSQQIAAASPAAREPSRAPMPTSSARATAPADRAAANAAAPSPAASRKPAAAASAVPAIKPTQPPVAERPHIAVPTPKPTVEPASAEAAVADQASTVSQ